MQGEGHIRIHQSNPFKLSQDITQLRLIRLQEFPAGRNIEKQVLHRKVTALTASYRFLAFYLRTGDCKGCSQLVTFLTGFKFHLCHSRNGGQRLPSESHGMQGKQVGSLPDFRSGMAFESQTRIGLGHTLSIVYHLDARLSGIGHRDINVMCSGIDGILHQLLDY